MRISFLTCFIFLLLACNSTKTTTVKAPSPAPPFTPQLEPTVKKPKNIIFMIGDGMGLTQITAGMYINGNKIELEKFPIVGLHKSYSSDNLVTDSASGATAFACGVKT